GEERSGWRRGEGVWGKVVLFFFPLSAMPARSVGPARLLRLDRQSIVGSPRSRHTRSSLVALPPPGSPCDRLSSLGEAAVQRFLAVEPAWQAAEARRSSSVRNIALERKSVRWSRNRFPSRLLGSGFMQEPATTT